LGPLANAFDQNQERKLIKFEDDYPDAVREVLRRIYGLGLEFTSTHKGCWRYWFELIKVAAKFNERALASTAEEQLVVCADGARLCSRIGVVCDILDGLHEIESRPQIPNMIKHLALDCRRHSSRTSRLRAYLFDHPDIMMSLWEECR
jgi:hypothetical protein